MEITIRVSWAGWLAVAALGAALFILGVYAEWPDVDWHGVIRISAIPVDLWLFWQGAKIVYQLITRHPEPRHD